VEPREASAAARTPLEVSDARWELRDPHLLRGARSTTSNLRKPSDLNPLGKRKTLSSREYELRWHGGRRDAPGRLEPSQKADDESAPSLICQTITYA
jgi:hypothetical protein